MTRRAVCEGVNGAWWLPRSSKPMRPDSVGLGGFDSHALPPRRRPPPRGRRRTGAPRVWIALLAVVVMAPFTATVRAQGAPPAATQPTAPVPPRPKPPISPTRAFFSSALVPGMAQARLNRSTGILFVTFEAISLTMYAKSRHDLELARRFARDSTPLAYTIDPVTGLPQLDPDTGEPRVARWSSGKYTRGRINARKTHVEDWVAALVFNHLFAGIDAFVAAQLWELPGQVQFRASPQGLAVQGGIRW